MAIKVPVTISCDHKRLDYEAKKYHYCERKTQVEADVRSDGHLDIGSIDNAAWSQGWFVRSHAYADGHTVHCPEHKDSQSD